MLDVCTTDPELGLECVRSLQAFLADSSAAVTALALKAIAALCRGDCLEFDAALRIVTKKGKVAHTGQLEDAGAKDAGTKWGDPLVMEALALVCGAGAEAAAIAAAEAAEESSQDSEEDDSEEGWGMANAVEILLKQNMRSHPDETVRAAIYAALGAHLPALLLAGTGQRADEDAAALTPRVREFLGQAMSTETGLTARLSLQKAASIMLSAESDDLSTWAPSKCGGTSRGSSGAEKKGRLGPSNRLLAVLPAPEFVLQTFHQDDSSCPGLAQAVLWSYPAPLAVTTLAEEYRDKMVRDFKELMVVEGMGGGLGLCPWQRACSPLGVQRFVCRLFSTCLTTESSKAAGRGAASAGAVAAVGACRKAIESIRGVPQGLIAVASASLASCVPASCSHVVVEEVDRAVDRLRSGSTADVQILLDGEEIFPLCAAIAVRALPETATRRLAGALEILEKFQIAMTTSTTVGGAYAPNEAQVFWSCIAIGVASEWSVRHPLAPEAKTTVSRAAKRLLTGLGEVVGSNQICDIAESWFHITGGDDTSPLTAEMVAWDDLDMGQVGVNDKERSEMGLPTTARGSMCLALCLGLSSTLPGLRATGLHKELRQVKRLSWSIFYSSVANCNMVRTYHNRRKNSLIDFQIGVTCLRNIYCFYTGLFSFVPQVYSVVWPAFPFPSNWPYDFFLSKSLIFFSLNSNLLLGIRLHSTYPLPYPRPYTKRLFISSGHFKRRACAGRRSASP